MTLQLRRTLLLLTLLTFAVLPGGSALAAKSDEPVVVQTALNHVPGDRDRALSILESAIRQRPAGKHRTRFMLHAGEQHRLAGRMAEAAAWFDRVIGLESQEVDGARVGMALIDAASGDKARIALALVVLKEVPDASALATQNADRYLFLAVEVAGNGDRRGAATQVRRALGFAKDDAEVRRRIKAQGKVLAKGGTGVKPMPVPGRPAAQEAEAAYAAGDRAEARRHAERALSGATEEQRVAMAGLIEALDAGVEDPDQIVVLLPLSGKYEVVGAQIRDALDHGYAAAGRQLVYVDSGGTPETAVEALDRAVLSMRAICVVGPLLSDETDAVVARAEALHVPLLSLSQAYETPHEGHYVLQAMHTRGDQIDALLAYVMIEKQMTSFAIFAPDDATTTVEKFRTGAEARGGRIATEALYSAEESNLLPFAKQLGVRAGNLATIRRQTEANGGNPDNVVLPPTLDFDAIFIPDSASRTPLAAAALAYEEFPMGDFQPRRSSPRIPLLGLSGWNTPALVATGNEYTRNSLFTDVFSAHVLPSTDPFLVAYRDATNRTPTALEAAVVDAGRLLAEAARSTAATRPAFRQALLDARVPDAVTGAVRIDPVTLRANRRMLILTITRRNLSQVGMVTLPLSEE